MLLNGLITTAFGLLGTFLVLGLIFLSIRGIQKLTNRAEKE